MEQAMKRVDIRVLVVMVLAMAGAAVADVPQRVILMISDGQGFNTVTATRYYTGEAAVFEAFPVRLAMQTSSADNPEGYDPNAMARDFEYARQGYTDSAAAATAMMSGVKVNNGMINFGVGGEVQETVFERAAGAGYLIGAVTTVPFNHATPAGVYGHNVSRDHYGELAREVIYGSHPVPNNFLYDARNYHGNLRVVMGAGHPYYTDSHEYDPCASAKFLGEVSVYEDLQRGVNGWTLVEGAEEFEALTRGETPKKVFGLLQVRETAQQQRRMGKPRQGGVPSLATCALGALNVLDEGQKGFALMIEGGAVDWANHVNQLDRMIEEQIDFNEAVAAVTAWIEARDGWDDTLLIVTADHECGYLLGPGGAEYEDVDGDGTFDPEVDVFKGYKHVVDKGKGQWPGAEYFSLHHTNMLVPFYAKGCGSERFYEYVIGRDERLDEYFDVGAAFDGRYIDSTAIAAVMREVLGLKQAVKAARAD